MTKLTLLTASVLLVLAANSGSAAAITSVCPIFMGGTASGEGVSGTYVSDSGITNGGCNVLITFNANGSITTTFPNAAISYDTGADDNMIGIINLTSAAIPSVTLTGTQTPFDFDGDGACDPTFTFGGNQPSGAAWPSNPCGTTSSGYGHQGVTFSAISINFDTGTVSFAGGLSGGTSAIGAGNSNWFSLEGPVDLNLVVTTTPEPASVLLVGVGFCGLGLVRRRLQGTKG